MRKVVVPKSPLSLWRKEHHEILHELQLAIYLRQECDRIACGRTLCMEGRRSRRCLHWATVARVELGCGV